MTTIPKKLGTITPYINPILTYESGTNVCCFPLHFIPIPLLDEVSEEPILEVHLLPSKTRLLLLMPHSLQARVEYRVDFGQRPMD